MAEQPPNVTKKPPEVREQDLLDSFKQFSANEKRTILERKKHAERHDRNVKLNDFKKFASTFDYSAPIPEDLIPILAKDPKKQKEIAEKWAEKRTKRLGTTPATNMADETESNCITPSEETTSVEPPNEERPSASYFDSGSSESGLSSSGSSVDSVVSGGSTSTAYSTTEMVSAAEEFSSLLLNDPELRSAYEQAFKANPDLAERFTRRFRRLLKIYAQDLHEEFGEHYLMALAVGLVRTRSRYIASQVRQAHDLEYRALVSGTNYQEIAPDSSVQRTETVAGLLPSLQGQQPNPDLSDTDSEDENNGIHSRLASLREVKGLLTSSNAYQKFRNSVHEFIDKLIVVAKPFQDIRRTVTSNLKDAAKHYVTIWAEWELEEFCMYELGGQESLEPVLTLSGSADEAYAGTCHDYVQRFWPEFGISIVRQIVERVQSSKRHPSQPPISNWFRLSLSEEVHSQTSSSVSMIFEKSGGTFVLVQASASRKEIIKLAQLLAWLLCVFRRPIPGKMSCSRCKFTFIGNNDFTLRPVPLVAVDSSVGSCWCPMMPECIIAEGFPIPPRETGRGLEMSFDIMVILGRILYPMEYLNGMVLKGRSTILVPISREGDSVQWHLLSSRKGTISMEDIPHGKVTALEHVNIDELSKLRTFVGFCENACVHAGGPDSGFRKSKHSDIPLEPWRAKLSREMTPTVGTSGLGYFGGQLGMKIIFPRGLSATIKEDDSLLEDELLNSKTHPCLVYDSTTKRGWLIPELNVLLLIAHVWAVRQADSEEILDKLPFVPLSSPGGEAAYQVVKEAGNPSLREASPGIQELKLTTLLTKLFKALRSRKEKVIERSDTNTDFPFLKGLKAPKLSGWELQDVASFEFYYRRKTVKLEAYDGSSWVSVAKENPDMVVLFCSGLNALIAPARFGFADVTSPPVPCGSSLLAATGEVILHMSQSLGTDGGCELGLCPPRLTTELYLDNRNGRRSFTPHEFTRSDGSICIMRLSKKPSELASRLKISDAVIIGSAQREQKLIPNPNRHKSPRRRHCLQREEENLSSKERSGDTRMGLGHHDHLVFPSPLATVEPFMAVPAAQSSYKKHKEKATKMQPSTSRRIGKPNGGVTFPALLAERVARPRNERTLFQWREGDEPIS